MTQKTNPPSLRELQTWLGWLFTEAAELEDILADPKRGPKPSGLPFINAGGTIDRLERLDIYANAYFSRMSEAMASVFECTAKLVGIEDFEFQRLCADFLAAHPSTSPKIETVAKFFPSFLIKHPSSERFPFISDLASLEWRISEAVFLPNIPPKAQQSLCDLPPESEIRVHLDPTVSLLKTTWPIAKLFRSRHTNLLAVPKQKQTEHILVYRDFSDGIQWEVLGEQAFALLGELQKGLPLEKAVLAVSGVDVETVFGEWIAKGVIRDVSALA